MTNDQATYGSSGDTSRQIATIGGSRRFAGDDVELAVQSRKNAALSVRVDKFVEVDRDRSSADKSYYSPE